MIWPSAHRAWGLLQGAKIQVDNGLLTLYGIGGGIGGSGSGAGGPGERAKRGADDAFGDLDLVDLNVVLYRAEGEERDATRGEIGAYAVPGLGALVYCGLEGFMHPLRHIMRYNDLGHPLCGHLRDGSWALDYVVSRLEK